MSNQIDLDIDFEKQELICAALLASSRMIVGKRYGIMMDDQKQLTDTLVKLGIVKIHKNKIIRVVKMDGSNDKKETSA